MKKVKMSFFLNVNVNLFPKFFYLTEEASNYSIFYECILALYGFTNKYFY